MTITFDPLEHETSSLDLAVLGELGRLANGGPIAETTAVEVGSWVGGTALVLARCFHRVYCIDTFEGTPSDRIGEVARRCGREHVLDTFCRNVGPRLFRTIIPVIGQSLDWARRWPRQADLVFLDADHTYSAIAADIVAWMPHVRPGGVLCGHDYGTFSGVTKAVHVLVPGFEVHGTVWFTRKGQPQ